MGTESAALDDNDNAVKTSLLSLLIDTKQVHSHTRENEIKIRPRQRARRGRVGWSVPG